MVELSDGLREQAEKIIETTDAMEEAGIRIFRLAEIATAMDVIRDEQLVDYVDVVAAGVAYGIVLAIRHPEYAREINDRMNAGGAIMGGDQEKSVLAMVVDKTVKEMPFS